LGNNRLQAPNDLVGGALGHNTDGLLHRILREDAVVGHTAFDQTQGNPKAPISQGLIGTRHLSSSDRDSLAEELVVAGDDVEFGPRLDQTARFAQKVNGGDRSETKFLEIFGGARTRHPAGEHRKPRIGGGIEDACCGELSILGNREVLDETTLVDPKEPGGNNLVFGVGVTAIDQHRDANSFHDGPGLIG